MLAAIENYQYSRMRVLHMISAYYICKQDKLMRKRKHIQIRRVLRKPCSYWYEKKTEKKTGGLKWFVKKLHLVAGKKNCRTTKKSFMKLLAKISPLISPKSSSPNYRLLSAEKKLAVTWYYLEDTESLWMTAKTFGLDQCTVSQTLIEVCDAINKIAGIGISFLA